MIRNWMEFDDGPSQPGPNEIYASINDEGEILLNRYAFEAMERPDAVTLLYDPGNDSIGLRPASGRMPNAFPLRAKGKCSNHIIRAKPFCERHEIKYDGTVRFLGAGIENGILVLDLLKTKKTTRKKRNAGNQR